MTCPHCGFANPPGSTECEKCGIVFAKIAPHPRSADPLPARGERDDTGATRRFADDVGRNDAAAYPSSADRLSARGESDDTGATRRFADGRNVVAPRPAERGEGARRAGEGKLLAFGFVGALIVHAFWITSIPFEILKTLFHEIGHAVAGWLLGYPSIPAFDFMFGGGLTHYGQFHLSIAIAVGAGLGYLGWRLRSNTTAVAVIGAVFFLWLIIVTKEWRRETVMASAGVIFELLLAATFLYMAVAGVGWRMPEIERPLGALIAFFVQFDSWIFSLRLMRDQDFLAWYQQGKGGALMNDLEVVALNLKIYLGMNTTIQSMAKLLFVFSFLPLGVAYWMALHHEQIEAEVESLVTEAS